MVFISNDGNGNREAIGGTPLPPPEPKEEKPKKDETPKNTGK